MSKSLASWSALSWMLLAFAANATEQTAATSDPIKVDVELDVRGAPELKDWAAKAGAEVEAWYPKVAEMLASEGFTAPGNVKLIFEKRDGIAGTAGRTIYVSSDWVTKHPDDYGMIIHEMVHVIQSYPKYEHVWLVEGIADYIRYFQYEPQRKLPPIDPRRAKYRDGYGTTAGFLSWVQSEHDPKLINKLNAALRKTQYRDELFTEYTGKSLDQLWSDFVRQQAEPTEDR